MSHHSHWDGTNGKQYRNIQSDHACNACNCSKTRTLIQASFRVLLLGQIIRVSHCSHKKIGQNEKQITETPNHINQCTLQLGVKKNSTVDVPCSRLLPHQQPSLSSRTNAAPCASFGVNLECWHRYEAYCCSKHCRRLACIHNPCCKHPNRCRLVLSLLACSRFHSWQCV